MGLFAPGRRLPLGPARHAARDDHRARADRRVRGAPCARPERLARRAPVPGRSASAWASATRSRRSPCGRPCPSGRRRGRASTRPGSRSARPSPPRSRCRSRRLLGRLARRADRAVSLVACVHRRRVGGARARRRGARAAGRARPAAAVAVAHGVAARRDLRARWRRRTTASTPGSPTRTASAGWSDESAGLLLAAMTPDGDPVLVRRSRGSPIARGRRPWLVAMSVVFAIGAVGLVALPRRGYLWALLAGSPRAARSRW